MVVRVLTDLLLINISRVFLYTLADYYTNSPGNFNPGSVTILFFFLFLIYSLSVKSSFLFGKYCIFHVAYIQAFYKSVCFVFYILC